MVSRQPAQLIEHLQNALSQQVWARHGEGPAGGGRPAAGTEVASAGPSSAYSPMGTALAGRLDAGLLEQLVNMGFPRLAASHALLATSSQGATLKLRPAFAHRSLPFGTDAPCRNRTQ